MSPDELLAFMERAPRPCKVSFGDTQLGNVVIELSTVDTPAKVALTPEQRASAKKAKDEAARRSDVESLGLSPPPIGAE